MAAKSGEAAMATAKAATWATAMEAATLAAVATATGLKAEREKWCKQE